MTHFQWKDPRELKIEYSCSTNVLKLFLIVTGPKKGF